MGVPASRYGVDSIHAYSKSRRVSFSAGVSDGNVADLIETLPIESHREAILSAVRERGCVVVEAPTGSGKSTRIPVWLESEVDTGVILVVQPRRVAARSLAGFLARDRGEPVGASVGYRVRFDDRTSQDTRLVFATPGVALRMLRDDVDRWPAAIILDEFHERGLEVDLCAALILRARENGRTKAPLILTSATLDGEALADRVGGTRITAEGRTYPVRITYHEDDDVPSGRDLEDRVSRAVRSGLREQEGDVLVFLPGKGEIDRCREALETRPPPGAEILPFHANLGGDAIDRVFRESDKRRVFLATNVAETSLTLPGVRTVIDAGLVRQMIHRGGRSALALTTASQASLDQRAGRAGRTAPGVCVRLFSSGFRPESADRPEIERLELDDLVIQAAACGLCGPDLADAPWVTPPPDFAIDRAVGRMTERGVLDADGRLSERGRALADLPVSASVARAVLDAPTGLTGTVADVVALVERGEGLLRFAGGGDQVREARARLFEDCGSDVEAGIRLIRKGDARDHGASRSALQEARRTAEVLRRLVGAKPIRPTDDDTRIDVEALARHLLSRLPEQAFVLRPRAQRARGKRSRSLPYANGEIELLVDRWTEDDRLIPRAGLVLRAFWSGSGKGRGVVGYGSLLLPCKMEWLAEAGLGEAVFGSVKPVRPGGDIRLVADVHRTLAGVTLSTSEEELRGDMMLDAAAHLIAENRLLKGAAARLADALHLAGVARVLRLTKSDVPFESVESAARARLEQLGVTASSDLSLLEPADLDIDLAATLDVDAADIEALEADFPRTWVHAGVDHRVTVERKPMPEVILDAGKTKSTRSNPPPPAQVPRFRDLPVQWRKASRTVRIR